MTSDRITPFGAALGARLRYARIAAKLSQGALGEQLGVSFQQVQKYEKGVDRVAVETLMKIAAAVGCDPARLLEDEPGIVALPVPAIRARVQMAEALDRLDPKVRHRLLALVAVLPPAEGAVPTAPMADASAPALADAA